MKFLSWMHHKLVQNNTETMKNSIKGNSSTILSDQTLLDEQPVEPTKILSHTCSKYHKSSNRVEANMVEFPFQEEPLELFDFLSIGTLGMELAGADTPTPTLAMPYEKMTNQQTEITENDLKLISYELEKFLEAEEKEIANDTSERTSRESITALTNKPIERADFEGHMHITACPLQNYLFANANGPTETDKEIKKEKMSLEELFRRNNTVTNDQTGKCEEEKQHPRKKNAANFMKKVVKKFCSSSSSSMDPSKNDVAASSSIKKKLFKALKMLHKKVHPEEMTEEHIAKLQTGGKKNFVPKDACQIREDDENNKITWATRIKDEKSTMKLSSNSICKGASKTTGGHWIKTDSHYLVLEL